jgi:hypothetical protein
MCTKKKYGENYLVHNKSLQDKYLNHLHQENMESQPLPVVVFRCWPFVVLTVGLKLSVFLVQMVQVTVYQVFTVHQERAPRKSTPFDGA